MNIFDNRKHGPQKSGMTHLQWLRAKRLRNPTRTGRWFWQNGTYYAGRNAAKRAHRSVHGVRK